MKCMRCGTGGGVELPFVGGELGRREMTSTKIVQKTTKSIQMIRETENCSESSEKLC